MRGVIGDYPCITFKRCATEVEPTGNFRFRLLLYLIKDICNGNATALPLGVSLFFGDYDVTSSFSY